MSRRGLPQVPIDPPLDAPLRPPQQLFRRGPALAPAPHWVAPFYLLLGVLLLPWTVYLGISLPGHASAAHYAVAWTGLDAMEIGGLVSTAYLAYRRSTWVEMAATVTGVLLVVDAWFDLTTSQGGMPLIQAILSAAVLEIPLALVSFYIARNAQVINEAVTRWLVARSVAQSEHLAGSAGEPTDRAKTDH